MEVKVLLDLLSRVFVNDFGALFLHCISAQMSTEEITKAGVEAYMRKRNGEATEDGTQHDIIDSNFQTNAYCQHWRLFRNILNSNSHLSH